MGIRRILHAVIIFTGIQFSIYGHVISGRGSIRIMENRSRLQMYISATHREEPLPVRADTSPSMPLDINGQGALTHTSVNDAEIVLDQMRGGPRKVSDRIPVYALLTDPPLGRVGLTEKGAIQTGRRVLRSTRSMSQISRAKEMGETTEFAKLLVDVDTDQILGASILGPGGDEIINMFTAIMQSLIPCREYRKVVLVHPTVSELMPWMLDGLEEITV